jgi:hypothetical protein
MEAGVVHGGIISLVLFNLYFKDISSHSRHIELAAYADDPAITATFRQPALLVKYLETYLSDLVRWLRELRIAIKVSKSTAILFTKASRRVWKPRPD